MKNRTAKIIRNTKETKIEVALNLDGTGKYSINTGVGFLDHMLSALAKHALFDLSVLAKGDLEIDEHHTVEDIGICLGQAIDQALGERRGIGRYGFWAPLDEALAQAVIDFGGRSYLVWNVKFRREKIGDLPTELLEDFFKALSDNARANIHINLPYGRNEHHMAEAIFKATARALRQAVAIDVKNSGEVPSTKGKI
ncbi:MAG: imidazoleglycerol-phosphate dehydratase [Candidatus Magasanikbacteria bacterium RIFOXYC2_FULL_42_28]|uniref:Imidazoleglycerol-phosphate dehydratase n=1 Tax=Candidatus Magasanikbacteria bacterium RIFOXYC2_FULL_42_28 TaxID=1798704 RepID=A0A1F6NW25_9BACT|nr:MAG: imidazoleglycerol-phosphate dehydratase [Candidatus Magasanikbacteria bacterium RIFOXYC2_FULL_42_28]